MHRLLLTFIFLGVWIYLEDKCLRRLGQAGLRSRWIYLERSRSPSPFWPALHFATLSVFIFGVWEFLLRWALLPLPLFDVKMVLGILGWCVFLALRFRETPTQDGFSVKGPLGAKHLWCLWILASLLLLGSLGTLLFLPWVYLRARFLTAPLDKTLSRA
jgi:hypothetical protein